MCSKSLASTQDINIRFFDTFSIDDSDDDDDDADNSNNDCVHNSTF